MSKANGRELGQGEDKWDKLAGKTAMTQFIAVSCFASTSPLKARLVLIPLTWEVQFTLENFLLLLPPSTITGYSKAPCRNRNLPRTCQPALLAQTHTWLAPTLFSWLRHALGFIFIRKRHTQINCVVTTLLPAPPSLLLGALQQAAAPSPLLSPGKVTDQEIGINA